MSTLKSTHFLKSVMAFSSLPEDNGAEVAFAGRSNAGKSSALNTLVGIEGLAKTSKTPGRTQAVNFFEIQPCKYLVDLPGYGYAKVSIDIKKQWGNLLHRYLLERQGLKGLYIIMDIRHAFQPMDGLLLETCKKRSLPVHVLLTKADKYSRGKALSVLKNSLKKITDFSGSETFFSCQLFSARTKEGFETARKKIFQWLSLKA